MAEPVDDVPNFSPFWQDLLSGQHPMLRRGRQMFRLLSPTATERCRLCYAGFDGFTAPALRLIGRGPWRRNPHMCEKCEAVFAEHRGGTELEIALLYADVRGSTQLAAGMRPAEFAALMQRFFRTATVVFNRSDAVVDKMVGDEVIALYLPGLAGSDYRKRAIKAGLDLLRATGHADPHGPWLPIGIGVHAGKAFVGSIGIEGGNYQFTALGDAMNFGARLVASAKGGEMIVSQAAWQPLPELASSEQRRFALKGYPDPVDAHVVRLAPSTG
ncbi:MAG TPA: adenylate/guanylate cyclase domain-containing protein [Bradyrhizobium sp.]|uniref:adenylate/guanylate cyclase domain-containing protein n=1 Tax=Bradyrhizobium sp. TaxID=376 RepID=UPI002D7E84F3|nr:adenylate/guanylate cyclase domain-containing protein [Bradyrhizobium sp.]HET7889524.1 adenylate/guanylate cyclase domain-containing protein [Bradyrhizobium sp.]